MRQPSSDEPAEPSEQELNELAGQILFETSQAALNSGEPPLTAYGVEGKGPKPPDLRDMPGPEGDGTNRGMTSEGYRGFLVPAQIPKGGFTTEPWTAGRLWERAAVPGILYEPFNAFNQLYTHFKNGGSEFDDAAVDKAFEIATSIMGGTNFKAMSKEAGALLKGLKGQPEGWSMKELPDGTWMVDGPDTLYFASSKKDAQEAIDFYTSRAGEEASHSYNLSKAKGPEYNENMPPARKREDGPQLVGDEDGNWKVVGPGATAKPGETHTATINFGQGARAKEAAEAHLKQAEDNWLFGEIDSSVEKIMKELGEALKMPPGTKGSKYDKELLEKLDAKEMLGSHKMENGKEIYYVVNKDGSLGIYGGGENMTFDIKDAAMADDYWKSLVDTSTPAKMTPPKTPAEALSGMQNMFTPGKDPKNPYGFPADYLWAQSEAGKRTMSQVGLGKKGLNIRVDGMTQPVTKFLYDNRDDTILMDAIKIANDNDLKAVMVGDNVIRFSDEGAKTKGGTLSPKVAPIKHNKIDLPTEQQILNWPNSKKIQHIGPDEDFRGPIVMYHGTQSGFLEQGKKFDLDRVQDFGHHFGTPEQASRRIMGDAADKVEKFSKLPTNRDRASELKYEQGNLTNSRIIPVVVESKKPMTMPDLGSWRPEQVAHWIEKNEPELAKGFRKEVEDTYGTTKQKYAWIRNKLNDLGYDSVRYLNTVEGSGWSYIVWRPSRVKSATNPEEILYVRGHPGLTLGTEALNEDREPRSP